MNTIIKQIDKNTTTSLLEVYQESGTKYILYTEEYINEIRQNAYMIGFINGATHKDNKFMKAQSTTEINREVERLSREFELIREDLNKSNDSLLSRIDRLDEKMDKKVTEISTGINQIDKRTVTIENKVKNANKNIENVISKLETIGSSINDIKIRLNTIETQNQVKETWKDRIIRQCLLPIIGGAIVFILGKIFK